MDDKKLTLDEWLEESIRIREAHPDPWHYCHNEVGTPKYDNCFDFLYQCGMTPQEALDHWRKHGKTNAWRKDKK